MAKRPNANPAPAATAPKAGKRSVRVRATQTGYYDHARRREGDVFTIVDGDFSDVWMEKVHPDTAERISTAQDNINRQHDEALAANATKPVAGDDTI